MGTTEQIADGAIDPNVTIPKHVRDAAAASDAAFASAYPKDAPEAPPAELPVVPDAPPTQPLSEPTPQEPAPEPPAPPLQPELRADASDEESWRHKFLSMQGRWQASQRQIGTLQQLNTDLGTELTRTQEILARQGVPNAPKSANSDTAHEKLITDQDRDTYGDDLIDVARRAGLEAVKPQLDALSQENEQLRKKVISNAQRDVKADLTRAVPNWIAIQRSGEFQQWLHLPNIYTGQIRGRMLNAAFEAADAPKVIAFYQDFLREVAATGGTPPSTPRQQQPAAQDAPVAPRQPVMDLGTLAAPGKARPASGDQIHQSADKPTYTRGLIAKNYADKRRGLWDGRLNDWNRLEQDMVAAGGEGRVRS